MYNRSSEYYPNGLLKEPFTSTNPYCYGKPSGFGDRIGIILCMSVIASLQGYDKISSGWDIENWRGRQYPEDVENYFTLPSNIKLVKSSKKDCNDLIGVDEWHHLSGWYFGIPFHPASAHKFLTKNGIINSSYDDYMKAYKKRASEIHPKFPLELPDNFYAVHIRSGDKKDGSDGATKNINPKFEKRILMRALQNESFKGPWIVLSDSSDERKTWSKYLQDNGKEVFEPEYKLSTNGFPVIQDFFTLLQADKIIFTAPGRGDYGGFSAFSYIPSVMRDIPLVAATQRPSRLDFFDNYSLTK